MYEVIAHLVCSRFLDVGHRTHQYSVGVSLVNKYYFFREDVLLGPWRKHSIMLSERGGTSM